MEANRELPVVGLEKDIGMGDFMEAYALGEFHLDIDDTKDTERFIGDMKRVLVDQGFYFGLEKFLRAKGIIKKSELVNPVIYFSESSGRIAVSPEDHNTHFNTYYELVKINQEAQNIIAEKPVEYQ